MASGSRDLDVVVVGAGFAGLAAARALAASGASTLVVEARDRVGGRTLNADLGGGKVVEIGGQWVGPTQDRLYELAAKHGVQTYPTYLEGENVLELGERLRRYRGTIPRLNPASLVEVELARRKLNSLSRSVPLERPWEAPGADRLDSTTLATWLRRRLRTRTARALVEIAVRTVWGANSADLSLLFALWYLHSGGGFDSLVDTEGGAQQDRFVGGSQLVALRMAEALGETTVSIGRPVTSIKHSGDGVVITAGGERLAARRVIVAMAPPLCDRIEFVPELPPARAQLAQRMPWGSYLKMLAIYDEPFWRSDGLSGESVSTRGPVTTTFDNSPPDGSPGILLAFVSGAEARALQRLAERERRDAVLVSLGRLFGPRARSPERFIEQDWGRERYTGGGPVCFMGPGVWTGYGDALQASVGPIHWAGTETSDVWSGYIEGAIRSGERAASEALERL